MAESISNLGPTAFVQPLAATDETSRKIRLVKTPQVEILQLIIPAGRDVPTHQAQGDVVVHCLEGRASVLALGHSYELKSGQILHLSLDDQFSIRGIENASVLVTLIAAKTGGNVELIGGQGA